MSMHYTIEKPMKKTTEYRGILHIAVLLALLLPSCRDPLPENCHRSAPGFGDGRISSALSVVPSAAGGRTKSSFTDDAATVSDWTLLQFDASSGQLLAVYYQASGSEIDSIAVVADRPYNWYAVANVGDVRDQFPAGETTENVMKTWTVTGLALHAAGLPMAWKDMGRSFSRADLSAGCKLEVALTRLVAKYDIVIDKSALVRYSFTATGATIEGPAHVRAFSVSRGTAVATTTDLATASDVAKMNGGGAVTFYAAENRYGDLPIADADAKTPRNIGAADHPTFIEITGLATMLDGSGLSFPTKYRFYLGTNATSNFDVIRNTENTVTLHLTDAKIDAAIGEQDAIAAGANPEPLWKVEVAPYTDVRKLLFDHGTTAGGAGIRLSPGERVAESVTRLPSGLSYQFRLDQPLYDAGIRVYLDEAGTRAVLPAQAYAEARWITLENSPGTLYFHGPSGGAGVTGQAHIRTLDGRKSDDLAVTSLRVLDRLEIIPSRIYAPGVGTAPETRRFKLYAYFQGEPDPLDITTSSDVTWTMDTPYNVHAYAYAQNFSTRTVSAGEYWTLVQTGRSASQALTVSGEYMTARFQKWASSQYHAAVGNYKDAPWVPSPLFTASYTFNDVTKTATVSSTLDDTRTVVSIAVTPNPVAVMSGTRAMLTATATYDDGTTADVTGYSAWADDTAGLLSNGGGGVYTAGDAAGTTSVTATFDGVRGSATVNVLVPTLRSVTLGYLDGKTFRTDERTVTRGSSQDWAVQVSYEENIPDLCLTGAFALRSSNTSVLTVSGVATHAEAAGESVVHAVYGGMSSSNSVKVTVRDHHYTYGLSVLPDEPAAVESEGGYVDYRAYYISYDNGIEVNRVDVSSDCDWSLYPALGDDLSGYVTLSGKCRVTSVGMNVSAMAGYICADYDAGGESYSCLARFKIKEPFTASLKVDPGLLEWDSYDTAAQTVQVQSNVPWRVEFVNGGSSFSAAPSSGSGDGSVAVSPVAEAGDRANGGRLRISSTTCDLEAFVDLVQYDWTRSPGNIQRRFVELYIARDGSTDKLTSDELGAGGSASYNLICHGQVRVGSGSWTDTYDVVSGPGLSWSMSPGPASLTISGDAPQYAHQTAKVANDNGSGTDQTVTLTAAIGGRIWIPAEYAFALGRNGGTASAVIMLKHSSSVPEYKDFRMSVQHPSIACDGTTTVSAWISKYVDGILAETIDVSSDTEFSISAGVPYAEIIGTNTVHGTNTTTRGQTVTIRASYRGQLTIGGGTTATASLTVGPLPAPISLSVSADELGWTWNECGIGSRKILAVTAMNCTWSVSHISDGFSYSVSGHTVNVHPDAENSSVTADKTGSLVIEGTGGVPAVVVNLVQTKKTVPVLTGLSFDRQRYDLVSYDPAAATFSKSAPFILTAHYSDGTAVDVSESANYSAGDPRLSIDKSGATFSALDSFSSGIAVAASYGGMTASCVCYAEDMEVPSSLKLVHIESQGDGEFIVSSVMCRYRYAFQSGEAERDVSDAVSVSANSPIRYDGYDSSRGFLFHFTSAGKASIVFNYTSNQLTVSIVQLFIMYADGHIEDI